ncbi:MAG: YqjF family protein [Actinomycetota bacterium]
MQRLTLGDSVAVTPPKKILFPVAYQDWKRVAFIHWRYPIAVVQGLLPDGLRVDPFDGDAWVTLSPFVVERLRAPGMPALFPPYLETNLRTYVIGPDGSRGILFLALDATAAAPVVLGRALYFQPYIRSSLGVEGLRYMGERQPSGDRYDVELGAGARLVEQTPLDTFLTGRWIFYTFYGGIPAAAFVEHEPWPLQRARVLACEETFTRAAGLPAPAEEPIAHYAELVHAKLSMPRPILRRAS